MKGDVIWTSEEAVLATGGSSSFRWVAQGVSIDSRTINNNDLFIALEGPNHDGHLYVADALKAGAAAAVVNQTPHDVDETASLLIVDDTQKALEDMAIFARSRVGARVCAITGSVGKTGAKEALRQCLERSGNTHVSAASYNNLWGVPLSLARMPRDTVYAVFEIGMNHPGEITPLAKMVRPHVAVVTTVEAVHLEYLGSIEAIADAKSEIFDGIEPGGVAILNHDNCQFLRLRKAALAAEAQVIGFGTQSGADVQLNRLALHPDCSCVSARLRGKEVTYKIGVAGRHWANNSLAVLAAVQELGGDLGLATIALANMQGIAGRGQKHTVTAANGAFELVDESYNASPASMRAALEVLSTAKISGGGRRVAVLGDMKELGDASDQLHAELAPFLVEASIDLVFCVGSGMAILASSLPANIETVTALNVDDVVPKVIGTIRADDVVMVKGSLASQMKTVVNALLALEPISRAASG